LISTVYCSARLVDEGGILFGLIVFKNRTGLVPFSSSCKDDSHVTPRNASFEYGNPGPLALDI
jgi:hypothetical protein